MRASAVALETISVEVPEAALEAFEAAVGSVCATVGFFRDHRSTRWRVEGVKPAGEGDAALTAALALATALTGVEAAMQRTPVPADGWLARTRAAFPQQLIGRRFAVRGTHLTGPAPAGRITLTLDAGLAFGSGEHGSTRGCLRALERVAYRRPRRILDMGTGSGILAMAAARLLHRRVCAVDSSRGRCVSRGRTRRSIGSGRGCGAGGPMGGTIGRCARAGLTTWCWRIFWRGRCA